MNAADKLVDWVQLADLLGDENDLEQRPMLAEMWRDMVLDLDREMAALPGLPSDDEAREALHRLRGVVSMWGLRAIADRMRTMENGPAPLEAWRLQQAEIVAMAGASRREVTDRHAWLGEAGET